MDDFLQDMSTSYVTSQMARRLAYQFMWMAGDEHDMHLCNAMAEEAREELPREWLIIAEDWCKDHKIGMEHGVMALMHLKSIFGMDFPDIVLRVILDDAWEIAKTIKVFKK